MNIDDIREKLLSRTADANVNTSGIVRQVRGLTVRALLDDARIGDLCTLRNPAGPEILAEIVGIDGDEAILSPFSSLRSVSTLTQVTSQMKPCSVAVGDHLLGHVVNAFGIAEGVRIPPNSKIVPVVGLPPQAMKRQLIRDQFITGIRAIDAMMTVGSGQRIGIFGSAGLGKSTLTSMLINHAEFDVAVIALVGERGREIREMFDHLLTPEVRARSVIVAATSDRPAIERRLAAQTAVAVAEGFRDEGRKVLLMVDSLTRFARAQREIGLAAGEPPVRRGFPPSMAGLLSELIERTGPGEVGSITAFFTVLVEGEIDDDPIAEEAKSLLDGHVILSKKLAEEGQFPAIDVPASRSRLMSTVASDDHIKAAGHVRAMLAKHREIELLLQIGEYRSGSDKLADEAVEKIADIKTFLKQPTSEYSQFDETFGGLDNLAWR